MEGTLCHDAAGIDEPGKDAAAAVPCCFLGPGWTYEAERVQGPEQMWLVRLPCWGLVPPVLAGQLHLHCAVQSKGGLALGGWWAALGGREGYEGLGQGL